MVQLVDKMSLPVLLDVNESEHQVFVLKSMFRQCMLSLIQLKAFQVGICSFGETIK